MHVFSYLGKLRHEVDAKNAVVKKYAYSVVSYTHTMLVPKTPEEPCGLQLSFFLHSANVVDGNTAVARSPWCSHCSQRLQIK
jgi:hypothetical protein